MEVLVPDLGDFEDVEVIEVLVKPGDTVGVEDPLITLETEKATMDVPSPTAGTVEELSVGVGSTVSAGDLIAVIAAAAEAAPPDVVADEGPADVTEPAPEPARPSTESVAAPPQPAARPAFAIDEAGFSRAHASPSVRKLARELGVDLVRVTGTGNKGRVTAADVKAFVKQIMRDGGGVKWPAVPDVDFSRFGDVEILPLSRIQKISGPRLHASWVNVPHVTQHGEADISDLESTRQSLKTEAEDRGFKLTPLAFIVRACALTLAEFPAFRSSMTADGESLAVKHYQHIGFAADTPNGLVVPVIRDADKKNLFELAEALAELSSKARAGTLKIDEMQGGVFTISSLGGIGGTYFTPIINAPEVAILGVGRSAWQPKLSGSDFVPKLMLPLSLSYDHRVIDGAQAARFITRLSQQLGEVDRLVEVGS